MKLLPLIALAFPACALPHYVEVGVSYGRGEFHSVNLEHEYGAVELRAGYVVRPIPVTPRLRYIDGDEVTLLGASQLGARSSDLRPDDQDVQAVRAGKGSDDDGGGEVDREGEDRSVQAPWYGRPEFLAAFGSLVIGIIGAFYRREIAETGRKVFKKKPRRREE